MSEFVIKKATRRAVKLKGYIAGPSGGGKTLGALRLMFNFLGYDAKLCVVDTENESASYYVGDRRHGPPLAFDTLKLEPPYTSARCIAALRAVIDGGFDGCIFDTISHQWSGLGGILPRKEEYEAQLKGRGQKVDSYTAWAKFTPEFDEFKAALLQAPIHLIVTVRAKQDYVLEDKGNGQRGSKVTKVGLKPEQREGLEYEFGFGLMLQMDNRASRLKDRTGLIAGGDELVNLVDPAFGKALRAWADEGGVEVDDGAPTAAADPVGADRPAARAAAKEDIAAIREAEQPAGASKGPCMTCHEERALVSGRCESCRATLAAEQALAAARTLRLAGKVASWEYKKECWGQKPIGVCPTPVLKQAKAFFEGFDETDYKPWVPKQIEAISLVLADRAKDQVAFEFPSVADDNATEPVPPVDTRLAPGKIADALEKPTPRPTRSRASKPTSETTSDASSGPAVDVGSQTATTAVAEAPPATFGGLARRIGELLMHEKFDDVERANFRAELDKAENITAMQVLVTKLETEIDRPF